MSEGKKPRLVTHLKDCFITINLFLEGEGQPIKKYQHVLNFLDFGELKQFGDATTICRLMENQMNYRILSSEFEDNTVTLVLRWTVRANDVVKRVEFPIQLVQSMEQMMEQQSMAMKKWENKTKAAKQRKDCDNSRQQSCQTQLEKAAQKVNSFIVKNEQNRRVARKRSETQKKANALKKGAVKNEGRLEFRKVVYRNGGIYEGQFLDEICHGKGRYTDPLGNTFDGEYRFNNRHGKGVQIYSNGQRYLGDFKYDEKNGTGRYEYLDGTVYEGQFVNDLCEGQGTQYYQDKSSLEGTWVKDEIHGKAIFTNSCGQKLYQVFDNGILLASSKEPITKSKVESMIASLM